jgi:glycosyltransferase involved in cell wall biosynthesis
MQEIKKRRIVIASVLKPVDDPRMMDKIGLSLASHHEVHIIGSTSASNRQPLGIQTHSLGSIPRLSLKRLRKRWEVFSTCRKLKPDLLIVCTHELLWQAVLLRLLMRTRIWYDVQENYYRNIRYLPTYPSWVRPLLAIAVRLKERIGAFFIERFLLAEVCYREELTFVSGRFVLLQNKVRRPLNIVQGPVQPRGRRLLFTGTLSESTGVFMAVDLAAALHAIDPTVTLTVCGFCPDQKAFKKVLDYTRRYPFVSLLGGESFVPHSTIVDMIRTHDFGIISYPPSVVTASRTPTKLFEYLALKLPVLAIDNEAWNEIIAEMYAGLVFKQDNYNASLLLKRMMNETFYVSDNQEVFWDKYDSLLNALV